MSTGTIIGGVAGAVVGFFIGGPIGAVWGAAIGMGIGMGIELLSADRPSPGEPELGDLAVNMAKEGAILPDILGTPKLNANILWSYGNRVKEVTEKQEGGKGGGGGEEVVTGYKYYLTWIVGICIGPVDKLFTIYKNDEVVWHGELDRPASGGVETITLEGMGAADFYFGTDDHALNSYIGSRIDDSTLNPPYRNMCWMLLKDCYIGDYNRAPSMHFVVGKYPDIPALTSADRVVEVYDYNPGHALYYLFNTLGDLPTAWLDADSFNEAINVLRAEGLGLTIQFNNQATAQAYAEMILQHIGGVLRYSGDSKFHLKLWRGTDLQSEFPVIDESSLLEPPTIERKTWVDTLNEVRVQHTNRFFRDLVCPSGCDGFEGDVSEIAAGENRTFTIQNSDWDELEGNCSDLSFLSDAMPSGKQGTFDNLQKISSGKWSFDYTSHASMCDGQDPVETEYCPIICGILFPCCGCDALTDVSYDTDNSAEEVAPDDDALLYVKDGLAPYTWEIVSGSGFSFSVEETTTLYNTIAAAPGTCGACEVKVTDACGDECGGWIISTAGQWVEIFRCAACGASDEGTCPGIGKIECDPPQDLIIGKYKHQYDYPNGFEYWHTNEYCPPLWFGGQTTDCWRHWTCGGLPPCGTPTQCGSGTPTPGRTCYALRYYRQEWQCI